MLIPQLDHPTKKESGQKDLLLGNRAAYLLVRVLWSRSTHVVAKTNTSDS